MIINLVLDPTTAAAFPNGLNSLPAAWLNPLLQAKTILQNTLTDNITVNIQVGYGEVTIGNGSQTVSAGGEAGPEFGPLRNYADVIAALKAHDPTNAVDMAAYNSLPATAPAGHAQIEVSRPEAKALGLLAADTTVDGSVGFAATQNLPGQTLSVGLALHELTHALGRTAYQASGFFSNGSPVIGIEDLFRFSSQGTYQFNNTSGAYLSYDFGKTNLANFDFGTGNHDPGDFVGITPDDPFNENVGLSNNLSNFDINLMGVIGYKLTSGKDDTPPVVTVQNLTAAHGQVFAAGSLAKVSDPDGDPITKYAFWNSGTGGAHFVLNGVVQGTNQEIDVTAAQLSQLSYQSGSAADTLQVRAYDGSQWSGWSNSFTVTGQADTAPTVTGSNVTATARGQSFAASSLFTARDADGDAITKFAFWDTGAGGGHFVLNGVAQGVAQEIDVTAAQLSQLSYQSGSAADTLQVRAYDGSQWSGWSNSFTVTGQADTAPTVTGSNVTATARGQSFAASSLLTAKDADGDAITKYAFWDTGTGGGHFVLNGVAQGMSQEIDVTAAQLSQLSYQSGSGADTLYVAAYDGTQWGNWSNSFTVTGQADTAPTVTGSNVTAARGQSFAASSLFTAKDADGDAITKFAFWDAGAGGGHFVLNGVVQGTNQEIDVTAAQLPQLIYQSGSAADTLWVRAYDGSQWSGWSNSFTVTGQADTAPTVTGSNVTAARGQSFAASSLFTARDADGDAITKYAFWDTGTGGGHFVLNGVTQGTSQEIDVTGAQLSQLSYQSGAGADTLWVRANDGTQWSGWSNSFTVTGQPDTAPSVTGSNVTAAHGQSFAASSLFTARDADGDAITKYAFWDAGSGGGHLVLNGVAQGVNQEIDVTAAQLSQLSYQSGSGADTLWVAAYDGTMWGNWSNSFSVTAPIDSGPTVTPTNSEIKSFANQNFAASSLFSYSDPFGSPATQYDFWNTGGGGGHFVLNGTALGANQHNIISATQLGQLSYQVGTGSDTIWVGANDGTVWGGWSKGFTISDPPAVAAGETITLGSGYAGQVDFLSDTGTLKLENSSSFAGTVAGLCGQDAIDFADIGFGANSTLGYAANSDHSGGTLSVGDGTHMANIALLGSYMASTFVAASDGHGGTLISEAAQASTQTPVVAQPHA